MGTTSIAAAAPVQFAIELLHFDVMHTLSRHKAVAARCTNTPNMIGAVLNRRLPQTSLVVGTQISKGWRALVVSSLKKDVDLRELLDQVAIGISKVDTSNPALGTCTTDDHSALQYLNSLVL